MKIVSSLQHPLVKRLTELRKERKARKRAGCAVIEGRKLVRENQGIVRTLLTIGTETDLSLPDQAEVYQVTPEIIQKISGVKTPEGILAEVEIPQLQLPAELKRLLVLENVNDPGNLGTLIRSSLAFEWDGVFLLGNCCDPFNDKAIRSSKGSVFKLPIKFGEISSFKKLLSENNMKVYIADLEGQEIGSAAESCGMALILGSEAHGPSEETASLGVKLTIPISGSLDSLNVAVAGGILLHHFSCRNSIRRTGDS